MNLVRGFVAAVVIGAIGMMGMIAVSNREPAPSAPPRVNAKPLLEGVFVHDQLALAGVEAMPKGAYRMLVDLRPDGEAPDQPPSAAVRGAAERAGLTFAYIPTPHGEIPDAVVDELSRTLAASGKPVLLYCRSGSRAARVWALAEASRPGGPDAKAIATAVRSAGLQADDLMPRIEARIALRSSRTN